MEKVLPTGIDDVLNYVDDHAQGDPDNLPTQVLQVLATRMKLRRQDIYEVSLD